MTAENGIILVTGANGSIGDAQIGAGLALMGLSLVLLVMARTKASVFAIVGLLAMGTAFVAANLAALISKRGESGRIGTALSAQMPIALARWPGRCWAVRC